jgi:hypothetical protein
MTKKFNFQKMLEPIKTKTARGGGTFAIAASRFYLETGAA